MHYAYSKRAEFTLPSMEDWEKQWNKNAQLLEPPKVVSVNFQENTDAQAGKSAEVAPTTSAVG